MKRALVVYSTLLVLAMVGAYLTWTAEPDGDDEDRVVVVEAKLEDITRVVYDSEDLDLTLEPREDERGRFVWVKATKLVDKAPPEQPEPPTPEPTTDTDGAKAEEGRADEGKAEEGKADEAEGEEAKTSDAKPEPPKTLDEAAEKLAEAGADSPPAETVEETTEFKAGEKGDELIQAVAPLRAKRVLDDVDEDRLGEFGLEMPEATLTIEREGREPRVLDLGASVFGGSSRYVRDRESGKIYLVDNSAFKSLERGDRTLADRRLRDGKTEDIVSVKVDGSAGTVAIEQHNRDDRDKAYWSLQGGDGANDTAKTWINKVFRLRSRGYVQAAEEPTGLEASFTFAVTLEDGSTDQVEVLRGQDPEGEEGWYARSDHTRGLVKLQRTLASEAAEDLASVIDSAAE